MSVDGGFWGSGDFAKSSTNLAGYSTQRNSLREAYKKCLKRARCVCAEITVEPCLFVYMLCIALSSFTVQNMHLEKACRVNLKFGDEVCDRIRDRNTTGIEDKLNEVQALVAKVIAWKFPLQTAVPACMTLFIGAWSDRTKRRKICILFPMIGEIVTNIGLLLATYYFLELSLIETALIEALPPAFTGSYIIVFMGMFSFMADRTTVENRTFRIGIVSIFVSLGTPAGTALSGILLRMIGYYGMFSLLLVLHIASLLYGVLKLHDVVGDTDGAVVDRGSVSDGAPSKLLEVLRLVANTVLVAVRPRANNGRTMILTLLVLYLLMVGPLYGDSQVSYLYAIRKFNFTEVEYSLYGTANIVLGLIGTVFCISVLSKQLGVRDSILGSIASASRIAACFAFAFAPTRPWYYCAPALNMFSSTGLTAIRAIATKVVPSEEVAKLSSLIGVMEAVAPSVYMPTTSYVYVSTLDRFPGAFYMFDVALTVLAAGLFLFIYVLDRRRSQAEATAAEHRAREVSRL